jgi:hypothetical protein
MVGLAGLPDSGCVDERQQLLCARHQHVEVHTGVEQLKVPQE